MKTVSVFLLISGLWLNALSAQNFANLDFETASKRSDIPDSWELGRIIDSQVLVVQSTCADSYIRITSPFTEHGSGYVHQDVDVSFTQLQQFRVTGMVRTQGITAGEGARLYAYGKHGTSTLGYTESENLTGDNDWTELSLKFWGEPRMEFVRLGCFLEGEGTAYFDDLSWEAMPPEELQLSEEANNYIDSFFQAVSTMALDREFFNWEQLKKEVKIRSNNATVAADTHNALRYCLSQINKHSHLISPEQTAAWSSGAISEDGANAPDIEYTTGHRIDEGIAYLSMPGVGSGHEETLIQFADSLQVLIKELDSPEINGWIIDLRNNTGGNCWPMLAGVGPILGEGVCGYFMNRDGSNATAWSYQDGSSFIDDWPRLSISGTAYELINPSPKVAVLTGERTGSSGEVMTIAFRGIGLPQVQSFGQATAGYSTTNTNIMLSDGAMILLTVSIYGDRDKVPYGQRIEPDVLIEKIQDSDQDATLTAALSWLKE